MAAGEKVGDIYLEASIDYDEKRGAASMRTLRDRYLGGMKSAGNDGSDAFSDGVDEGNRRNRGRNFSAGKVLGQLFTAGAAAGMADNAKFLRDAMILIRSSAISILGVGISGAIQAAFAIGPAALAALPGLLLGAASAAGILQVALGGVGKAWKSAFKEDFDQKGIENFNESLKGLSFHAASFIRTVRGFVPQLKSFQRVLADAFFGGNSNEAFASVVGALKKILPSAAGVADKFGDIARALAFWISSAKSVENFKKIFAGIDAFLDTIRPSLINVLDAFLGLGAQGAQFAESLGQLVSKVLDKIAKWARETDLRKVFNDAKPALEDIHRIFDALWGTIQVLFGGADAKNGGGPLDLLATIAEKIELFAGRVRAAIDMLANLPDPMKQLLGFVAAMALISLPLSSLVGTIAGLGQSIMGLVAGLGALGIAALPATAIILGVIAAVAALAGIFVLGWTRSEEFRNKIKDLGSEIKRMWEEDFKPALSDIGDSLSNFVTQGEGLLASFGLDWGDLGQAIEDFVLTGLGLFLGLMQGFQQLVDNVSLGMFTIKTEFNDLKNLWDNGWGLMKLAAQGVGDWFASTLVSGFAIAFNVMELAADHFKQVFTAAFHALEAAAMDPIKIVVQFINDPLLKGYNIIARAVGIDEIQPIVLPFAHGGIAPGVGNKDSVHAMLTPGEGILTKDEMARLGGPSGFNHLRGMIQHFAGGGIVQTLQEAFGSGGGGGVQATAGLSAEQVGNASRIVQTGRSMGVPQQGLLVALITAMQESNLKNIGDLGVNNDHDSVGLFQQRPSQGWGSVAELMNPAVSASKFFAALARVPGWQGMDPGAAAQSVQRSAFPGAYTKWISLASNLLGGGGIGSAVSGFFGDPKGNFISGMLKELPSLGNFPFAQALTGMAKNLITGAANKALDVATLGAFSGGGGLVGGLLGGKGAGMAAIMSLVSGLAGFLHVPFNVTSSYRPGDPGYHGQGRAVDFGGFNQDALASALYAMGGNLLELIHTTDTRGYYIKNGKAVSAAFYGDEVEKHRNHIHVAMDEGGGLAPGTNTLDNFTGRPEAILNPRQSAFVGRVLAGEALNIENILWIQIPGIEGFVEAKIVQSENRVAEALLAGRS